MPSLVVADDPVEGGVEVSLGQRQHLLDAAHHQAPRLRLLPGAVGCWGILDGPFLYGMVGGGGMVSWWDGGVVGWYSNW